MLNFRRWSYTNWSTNSTWVGVKFVFGSKSFEVHKVPAPRLNCIQSLNRAETRELMLLNYARREIHQQYKFSWKSKRKLFHLHAEWANRKKWHNNSGFHSSLPMPVCHSTLQRTYFNLHLFLHLHPTLDANSTQSWCINRSLTQFEALLQCRNLIFASLRVN